MARYRIIDTATWPRRDHFTFYRQFANPSFNLCVPIAAQRLYECAKDRRVSFFQLALYALLRAANGVPQLRQRVRNDEVIEYDSLAVMTPVMTVEEGFRQVWCDNAPEFTAFSSMTHAEYAVGAAVPALTWGKLQNGVIPVAGRFNHAFVDGLHASRFFALVEEGFSDPERLWQPLTETAPSLLAPAPKKR